MTSHMNMQLHEDLSLHRWPLGAKAGNGPATLDGAASGGSDGDACGPRDGAHAPGTRRARHTRMPRRNRRGLIGMLLSIVVAVVIVIAIFAIYNQLTASASAAQTAVFVRQVAPQITNQYRGNYTGLNNAAAVSSGFIPDNWRNGANIEDPDGTTVTIASANSNANFTITFVGGVPVQTCKAVLGALKTDRTFDRVTVGSNNRNRDAVDTPAEINTQCTGSGGGFVLQFK